MVGDEAWKCRALSSSTTNRNENSTLPRENDKHQSFRKRGTGSGHLEAPRKWSLPRRSSRLWDFQPLTPRNRRTVTGLLARPHQSPEDPQRRSRHPLPNAGAAPKHITRITITFEKLLTDPFFYPLQRIIKSVIKLSSACIKISV